LDVTKSADYIGH